MIVYLLVLVILLIGVFNYEKKKLPGKNKWYILEWLILVLVAGLRYKIGGDTAAYMRDYDLYPTLSELSSFDFAEASRQPLWYLFCALCKAVNTEFVCFQLIHSIVVNTVILWFFKKHSQRPFVCVLIYALFFYMNYCTEVLRASLSVCMFLLSYDYLIGKKWLRYALFSIIAYGFHAQAIVMLLFPLCHVVAGLSFFSILSFAIGGSIVVLLMDYIPIIGEALQTLEAVAAYMEHYSSEYSSLNIFGIISASFTVLLWLYLLYITKDYEDEKKFFLLLMVIFTVGSMKYRVIFGRNLVYAYPLVIIYIVAYYKKLLHYTLLYACIFYTWLIFYTWKEAPNFKTYRKYYPYASWIDKTEDTQRNAVAGRGVW